MFKKLLWLLIPLAGIACFVLVYLGAAQESKTITHLGLGILFGTVFLVMIILITVSFVRSYKRTDNSKDYTNPQLAYDFEDRYEVAEYVFGRSIFGFRIPAKKAKIFSYLIMLFLIFDFSFGFTFLFTQIIVPAVVCLVCFGLTLFICMLCAVLRFIFTLGREMKKQQDSAAETEDDEERILRKYQNEEFEYHTATVLDCFSLPSPDGKTGWYEFRLDIDGVERTIRHVTPYEKGTRLVVYSLEHLIFVNDPKTRKLQAQDKEEQET